MKRRWHAVKNRAWCNMANSVTELAAEPMAFFPHDATASADIKCQRLIRRMGYEGYGRWWRLCEHLAATKGHAVPYETHEDKLILGGVLGFSANDFEEFITIEETDGFISCLLDLGLLQKNQNGELFSERMAENSLYFGKQRYNGRKGGRPKKNGKTADEQLNDA